MILIAPIYLDAAILPHFLRHYSELGVTAFHFAINTRLNPTIADQVQALASSYPVHVDAVYEVDDVTSVVAEHLNAIRLRRAQPDEWIAVTDLDEFFTLDRPLADILAHCDAQGHDHIVGRFVDRVAIDGRFPALAPAPSLFEQYPLGRRLTRNLLGGNDVKVVLHKARCEIIRGHHRIGGGRAAAPFVVDVHHFKWKAGVIERHRERLRVQEQLGLPWAHESRSFLAYVDRHGRIDIDDPRFFVDASRASQTDRP